RSMIARHNIIFTIGVVIFIASFFIPIDDTQYGYAFALFVFTIQFHSNLLEAVWSAFLTSISNLAALVTIVAYFTFFARWVSVLAVVGTGMAIYWTQQVVRAQDYFPQASICWTLGCLLIAVGYEMKRRVKMSVK
ncbi:MAG TPA: hypothetical protein VFW11_06725, partial [Cyclobacteriaceae bacterium]|nr:hypothetical protein [Cyclobacteriaceae bacterium]